MNSKKKVLLTEEECTRIEELKFFSMMTDNVREIRLYRTEVRNILNRGGTRGKKSK